MFFNNLLKKAGRWYMRLTMRNFTLFSFVLYARVKVVALYHSTGLNSSYEPVLDTAIHWPGDIGKRSYVLEG